MAILHEMQRLMALTERELDGILAGTSVTTLPVTCGETLTPKMEGPKALATSPDTAMTSKCRLVKYRPVRGYDKPREEEPA